MNVHTLMEFDMQLCSGSGLEYSTQKVILNHLTMEYFRKIVLVASSTLTLHSSLNVSLSGQS